MPQGPHHHVILVGLDQAAQAAAAAALHGRPATAAADFAAARRQLDSRPGEAHLFVVQLPPGAAEGLHSLTAAAPGQPVIALLPPDADLAALLAAQRAGAAQVLPLPIQPADLAEALGRVQAQFAPPARAGTVVAVCGVSGGCGGTTVALNLACELGVGLLGPARGGCVLVELTRQIGTLATYLDVQPPVTTPELLADASRLSTHGIRQALTSVTPGLDVLVGPYQELSPGSLSSRHLHPFVALCRRLAGAVVLDVPCAFDDWQFEAMALADHVILVGVQSVSSVRTLKLVRDALLREEGVVRPLLVVNRYEPSLPGFSAARLAELLGVDRVWTVANDYPSVMAANNHGKPLQLAAPHSPVLADMRALAAALLGPAPAATGDRLARALGRAADAPPRRAVRVLHVEDDPVQQEAVALYLKAARELECQVTAVASEAEAVAAFRNGGIDLVLLDFHLSQGDGLARLRQLRQLDAIVPIVVVSGLEEPQLAAQLLEAGADDFLSKKNFSGPQLGRAVAAAVARAGAVRALGAAAPPAPSAVSPDEQELLRAVAELRRGLPAGAARPEQVQRLAESAAAELGADRRAVLTLFLRVFGTGAR